MGSGYVLKCKHCNHEVILEEGIGFFDYRSILKQKPSECGEWKDLVGVKRILKNVDYIMSYFKGVVNTTWLKENEEMIVPYGYRFYYSPKSKQMYSKFYFELEYTECGKKKVYTPDYTDKEGNLLLMVEDITSDIVCPKCNKEYDLNEIEMIMFD